MKVVVEPIRSEADYARVVQRIQALGSPQIGTPEGDLLDVLTDLAHAYFRRQHSGEEAHLKQQSSGTPTLHKDPVSAIRAAMQDRGMKPIELGPILGSTSRAYEVLNGKRGLSIAMIRALHKVLGIPLEDLVGE